MTPDLDHTSMNPYVLLATLLVIYALALAAWPVFALGRLLTRVLR